MLTSHLDLKDAYAGLNDTSGSMIGTLYEGIAVSISNPFLENPI